MNRDDQKYLAMIHDQQLAGVLYMHDANRKLTKVDRKVADSLRGLGHKVAVCALLYPTHKETYQNFFKFLDIIPPGELILYIPPYAIWTTWKKDVGYGISLTYKEGIKVLERYGIRGKSHFDAQD